MRSVLYELKHLQPKAPAYFELSPRENSPVFCKNGLADIQPGRSRHREHQHGALEPVWFQSRRDQDVCVNDEAKRDHRCFVFCARAALITRSIWREVMAFVPLRRDSSPISLSTSGSG